jgi:hypothetical protein
MYDLKLLPKTVDAGGARAVSRSEDDASKMKSTFLAFDVHLIQPPFLLKSNALNSPRHVSLRPQSGRNSSTGSEAAAMGGEIVRHVVHLAHQLLSADGLSRPKTIDEVSSQENTVEVLRKALTSTNVSRGL